MEFIYLLLGKTKKKKDRNKKTPLFILSKLGATFRVRTGGQKLIAVAQPFLSCLPALRYFHKSPEEDSTGVNALTPLGLGGDGDTADLSQLRLWLL